MKSTKYTRIAFRTVLIFCGCCLIYFLSTGPAVSWLCKTGNDTVAASLRIYLKPLILIDRRFNHDKEYLENLKTGREWEVLGYSSVIHEPTLSHRAITEYLKLWGEEASYCYWTLYLFDR